MMPLTNSSNLILAVIFAAVATGFGLLAYGQRLRRAADGLAAGALFVLFGVTLFLWHDLIRRGFDPDILFRGWVFPREEQGSLVAGIGLDPLALIMTFLGVLVAGLILACQGSLAREARRERVLAALLFSTGGLSVCWLAITPWTLLFGLALMTFGGFLSFGSRWDNTAEARAAARFAWSAIWGNSLIWIGVVLLAGSRVPLLWGTEWAGLATASGFDWVGGCFLVFGVLFHFQAFPLMGWLAFDYEIAPLFRVALVQVFPAWAAMAVLVRAEPQLRTIGIFPMAGWAACGLTLLVATAGLFEPMGRLSLGRWVSAGFSLSLAGLAVASREPGFTALLSVGLGALGLAAAAAAFDIRGQRTISTVHKTRWTKAGAVVGLLVGLGAYGFLGAGAYSRIFFVMDEEPVLLFLTAIVFLVWAVLGWKLAAIMIRLKSFTDAAWVHVFLPAGFGVLALGLLWQGTLTGGGIPEDPDRMWAGMLPLLFGSDTVSTSAISGLIFLSVSVVAAVFGLWAGRGKEDLWARLRKAVPGFSRFILSGCELDALGLRILKVLRWLGGLDALGLRLLFPGGAVPKRFMGMAYSVTDFAVTVDARLQRQLNRMVAGAVYWPARTLQFIQNGDVQWYLVFALSFAVLMFLYFFGG